MSELQTDLAINAAFLREIKEEDQQLRDLFQEVTTLLSSTRPVSGNRLVTALWQLRDQLGMHFALECAFGYMADVVEHAPRLGEAAKAMLAEHDELFIELCEIIDTAEQLAYEAYSRRGFVAVAADVFNFQARFFAHESRENQLMFAALNDDIGVGD
jgi:hypothetical protein